MEVTLLLQEGSDASHYFPIITNSSFFSKDKQHEFLPALQCLAPSVLHTEQQSQENQFPWTFWFIGFIFLSVQIFPPLFFLWLGFVVFLIRVHLMGCWKSSKETQEWDCEKWCILQTEQDVPSSKLAVLSFAIRSSSSSRCKQGKKV